jgi:hypothetical protein
MSPPTATFWICISAALGGCSLSLPSSGPLGPPWGHIRATNDRSAADKNGHRRPVIRPAHRPGRGRRRRSPRRAPAPSHGRGQVVAGPRLGLRAAGPLPHRPRPAGAGRRGTLLPWPVVAVTHEALGEHAAAVRASRTNGFALVGSASRDPGHSFLTRERRPAWDRGSGGEVWPSAGGRCPPPRPLRVSPRPRCVPSLSRPESDQQGKE